MQPPLSSSRESDAVNRNLDRNDWLVILALTLLAAAIRLPTLGTASLWFDELCTWKVSNQASLIDLWTKGFTVDIFPPAYFTLTYFIIKLLGDGEFAMRLPAALFGILSVPAIYALGRKLFCKVTATLGAALVTLSYTCIYYSQEARPYSMMMFLTIVTTYLWHGVYAKVIVRNLQASWSQILALVLVQALFCYTHYLDVLVTGLQMAFFFAGCLRTHRGFYILGWTALGLALFALLWLPELRLQTHNHVYWIPVTDPISALNKSVLFLFSGFISLGYASVAITLAAFVKNGGPVLKPEGPREYKTGLVLVGACMVSFALIETLTLTVKPLYLDRYLTFCLPFAYLVIARQIDRLQLRPILRVSVAIAPLLLTLALLEQGDHSLSKPRRDNWRGVVATMAKRTPPDSKVSVLAITEQSGVSQYYFGRVAGAYAVDAEAIDTNQLPAALNRVMESKPDYIWLFHGQVSQVQTVDAAKAAISSLQGVGAEVDSMLDVDRNVGADLYKINKD